jgi:DNA-binding transcriptional ArsR family regulator
MANTFEALVDPTRRHILDMLRERPRMVGELVDALDISQPGVSKHLRVLREAGLVNVRQDAQRRWYEVNPAPLAEVQNWLEPYRQLLEERYERLDDLLSDLQNEQSEENDNEQG